MKYFIYIALTFAFFSSCKPEKEEAPTTSLEVRVLDEDGTILTDEVKVYLFINEAAFTSSVLNEQASGFFADATSSGGSVSFSGLDFSTPYFVYIYYDGKNYPLNNYFSQYQIKNLLQADRKTIVQIQLTPYNIANIGFYTTSSLNLKGDPIKLYFDTDPNSIGTLESISDVIPTSENDPGVVKVLYQDKGVHTWFATGANGCHWQGQINITDTNKTRPFFQAIPLEACDNGVFSFWSGTSNLANAGGEIVVVLDNLDTVGYINSARSTAPNSCNEEGFLLVSRPLGMYSYHAYAKNGNCAWQGLIDISDNDCATIDHREFKDCN